MKNEITLDQARKVLEVVDAGLSDGMGKPVPGQMCVEAAVCYALGQPHGDEPECVNEVVRKFKIRLNDSPWSSNEARAAGMRRLAIAQLGTNDKSFDEKKFVALLVEQTIRKIVPHALRCAIRAAGGAHKASLEDAAMRCERDGNSEAAKNARRAAHAAGAASTAAYAAAAYAATAAAAELANAGAYATDAAAAYAAADAARATASSASIAADAIGCARWTAAADTAYAATTAATAAAEELANGGDYAPEAAADTANAASSYRDRKDTVLCISADIGVEALRAAGAHGIKLMDQLILA